MAILSEVPYCEGQVIKSGTVTFVEQEPVIFTGTLKTTFSLAGPSNLKNMIALSGVAAWKKTSGSGRREIRLRLERGVTLSGGQKARLALARALYAEKDIYLLDDHFSAVDARVGRSLFEELLKEVVGRKTVVLATHQIHFLSKGDQMTTMEMG